MFDQAQFLKSEQGALEEAAFASSDATTTASPQTQGVVKPTEVAALQAQTPIPTTIYERNVYSVRLPDGRLQLVSQ